MTHHQTNFRLQTGSNIITALLVAILMLFCLQTGASIQAEIPPRYYQEAQAEASEHIQIEVLDVSKDWYFWRRTRKIEVQARVLEVFRSKLGLKAGQQITIQYTHKPLPQNSVGPRPIPILQVGITTPAWLRKSSVTHKDGLVLSPAARGYSFERARY